MIVKLILVTFAVATQVQIGACLPKTELTDKWNSWKNEHSKFFHSHVEETKRFKIWSDNLQIITEHNKLFDAGLKTYSMGLNHLADLSNEEFRNLYFPLSFSLSNRNSTRSALHMNSNTVPSFKDWVKEGYVTGVKDQKHCGSCWSFSATGAMEGALKRSTGKLRSLSEQQLIDCAASLGTRGCRGGNMYLAFQSVIQSGGIETELSYPYEAHEKTCRYRSELSVGRINSFKNIGFADERELMMAVGTIGPVSVAINAHHAGFVFYKSGVYYEPDCNPLDLSHAVLVVGYGTTNDGQEYWKLKNSWGLDYGYKGFMHMARNRNNCCGIASAATYPIV